MEARRTFHGAKSYGQLWIIVAALMAAAVLGVGGAVVAGDLTSAGKAPQIVQTHAAPGSVLNQDNYRNAAPSVNGPSKTKQTVF